MYVCIRVLFHIDISNFSASFPFSACMNYGFYLNYAFWVLEKEGGNIQFVILVLFSLYIFLNYFLRKKPSSESLCHMNFAFPVWHLPIFLVGALCILNALPRETCLAPDLFLLNPRWRPFYLPRHSKMCWSWFLKAVSWFVWNFVDLFILFWVLLLLLLL